MSAFVVSVTSMVLSGAYILSVVPMVSMVSVVPIVSVVSI